MGWRKSTVLAISSAMLAAAPAHAQVRLGPETGAPSTVHVMSWWAIPFRTVVRQQYDFSCGSAAVATLLTYGYDRPTTERESFAAMWKVGDREMIRKKGFSLFDMRAYLQSIGYRVEGFKLTMDQLSQLKRPVIVLLDLHGYKHFAVVKGMADGQVLTGDPMLGLTKYDSKQFARYWNGVVLAILAGPYKDRPVYNLPSDWNPWARAPLDAEAGTTTAIADLTTYLPPQYQITPLLLLDVRVGTVN
ncbi:C39 family peptidase [Stakelama marina]|uniref:C39 family peptidase n=1 Tax=Stakelama marina TaxID=2826939 RepID=A0A8T4IBV2_9SPHN|nr:C39 family peptidase [Stakelama marina]MBR0551851.1 C39 family peptidase [Stakelama marina]